MWEVERRLAEGEQIVYKTRMHWVIFIWPFLCFLLMCAAFLGGFDIAGHFFGVLIFFALAMTGMPYVMSEFVVTNRRVIFSTQRRTPDIDIPLLEIRDIAFEPGLLENFFSYGAVIITNRQGEKHTLGALPREFYKQVQERLLRIQRILK